MGPLSNNFEENLLIIFLTSDVTYFKQLSFTYCCTESKMEYGGLWAVVMEGIHHTTPRNIQKKQTLQIKYKSTFTTFFPRRIVLYQAVSWTVPKNGENLLMKRKCLENTCILWVELCLSKNPCIQAWISNVVIHGDGVLIRSLDIDMIMKVEEIMIRLDTAEPAHFFTMFTKRSVHM